MPSILGLARRLLVLPQPWWWSHNDHYHRLLLDQVPEGALRALDVGCGTGAFARKLAARVEHVDAIDRSSDALALARERSRPAENIRFTHTDLFDFEPDPNGYDVISLIAVIHHMDFHAAAGRLRTMLAPGGVVAILGIAREDTLAEYLRSAPTFALNAIVGAGFAARRAIGCPAPIPTGRAAAPEAPVRDPEMTYRGVRAAAPVAFPGSSYRRLLFWRYLLTYRRRG